MATTVRVEHNVPISTHPDRDVTDTVRVHRLGRIAAQDSRPVGWSGGRRRPGGPSMSLTRGPDLMSGHRWPLSATRGPR